MGKMKTLEVQGSPLPQSSLSRMFSRKLEPASSAQGYHPGSDLSSSCLFPLILAEASPQSTGSYLSPGLFSESKLKLKES